jgi:hypothetical protein
MEGSVQVFVRRQFETDDDALRISLDTMDDLLALMEMERCAEARILCKGPGMPVLIELPATAAVQRHMTAEIDRRIAKRMDLNRMAKHLHPLSPEEWMSEEQLAHYRATGDINWRHFGTPEDRRFGLE